MHREAVGAENFFLFGLTAEEVAASRHTTYSGRIYYDRDPALREVIDLIGSGHFAHGDPALFRPLVDTLLGDDYFRVMADFAAYRECQQRVDAAYQDRSRWARMMILNIARMGRFSSDRTIREYAREIWGLSPVEVVVPPYVSTDEQ